MGVTTCVVVLIVFTVLLTTGRSDYDRPPGYATPEIDPPSAPAAAPSSSLTPMPALPQAVVTALGLRPSDSSTDALPGTAASMSSLADFEQDVITSMPDSGESTELADRDSELSSLQLTPDGFGEFVLAERGIHFDWKGCEACERPGPVNLVPWGGMGLPGSGGGGPAGASFLPELGNPSPLEIPVFEELPPPGGNPPGGNPPGGTPPEGDPTPDPPDDEPRPKPPAVPVPEPSTVMLMSAALSLMIGGTRARKRQR